ncbi:carboxylesterase family protein [Variovorax sp. J22R133]|uniref:carboxylesterase family protein n=1 Tax=Variovorax brevis TaxID=3053503 RepID=UPI0025770703|nr:carboxylesterase family protein [Variovorax sp. J22R133]MDM0116736.1 carboxylesterase family protein [Variovorax sp. J22R133]
MSLDEHLHFSPFRLDLANERLWRGAHPVSLRPKAYALLRYLAENPNRLIPQAEVVDALWHHRYLSDSLLRGYVRELRCALGDDAKAPRFIETVSARGYRFLAAVNRASPVVAGDDVEPLRESDRPAIAVLAFSDPQHDPDGELLARGVAEDLIAELARNVDLRVVSQYSSFAFASTGASLEETGKRLGCRYLVDGTVRREGETLRIGISLIDSHDGRIVWSSQHTTDNANVLRTRDELVCRIAGTVLSRVRHTEYRRVLTRPPMTLDVYDLTLRAMSLRLQFRAEATRQARALLGRALAIDERYAPAWLAIGWINAMDAEFRITGEWDRSRAPTFLAQVKRAIAIDPEVPAAYLALCQTHFTAGNFAEALAAAQRGTTLGPSDAACWCHLSMSQLSMGQIEAALRSSERALALTPLPPAWMLLAHAGALWANRSLEAAVQAADECVTKAPSLLSGRVFRICGLVELGRIDEARREAETLMAVLPKLTTDSFQRGFADSAKTLRERSLAAALATAIPMPPPAALPFSQLAACAGIGLRSAVERDTRFGTVVGLDESAISGTYVWKGVPFAKPPTGALRWRAPVDPDVWAMPRATQQFGNACVQSGRIYGHGPGANNRHDATICTTLNQTVGSEDCLYLNIWRPSTDEANLPVIVYLHGGSNVSGYTADPIYDGAALARTANAVVVTVAFRLGVLGFLHLSQLKAGVNSNEGSGNFALLDCMKALLFVNREIATFGGAPDNVTLMGNSAGAINVYALLTSPLMVHANPKLFHRAVPLSGGLSLATNLPSGMIPTLYPASTALAQANALLYSLLIADGLATDTASAQAYAEKQSDSHVARYMRSKSADALLGVVLTKLAPLGLSGSGPIPEGTVLPLDPIAAINAGNYVKVPILAGNTRDEAKLFPTFLALSPALGGLSGRLVSDATLFSTQFNYDPEAAPTVTIDQWIPAEYLPVTKPGTGFNAKTDLLNQLSFIASRDNILDALEAQQRDVWHYQFNWDEEPAPWDDIYGAAHEFDLPFVFGNFGPSIISNVMVTAANQPGRLGLSDAMMKSLGAFAKNGDPNCTVLGVTWPEWPGTLIFDATKTEQVISAGALRPDR